MEVQNKPLFFYMLERVRASRLIDDVIIATTINSEDDPLEEMMVNQSVKVFRGSVNNVLDRYYHAAIKFGAEHIMRLTADCPLIDPDYLDVLIEFYMSGHYDYACNFEPPTLPDGLDAEIFSFDILAEAHSKAILPSHLEHVTEYILQHPEHFKIGKWTNPDDYSYLRWTVDEPCDFEFVRKVFEALYNIKKIFRTKDILNLLKNYPEMIEINAHLKRNEGFLKSLAEDKEWLKNHGIDQD